MAKTSPTQFASLTFEDLVLRATGCAPYPYQVRLAEEGLPELLKVPTGTGKTLAATLPWLYRRLFHVNSQTRGDTPRWLVFVLPMRVLVEQTAQVIRGWIEALELAERVDVHVVMGGDGKLDDKWRNKPGQEAIFVGTVDMLLSRALNRGFGATRFTWPIDFGLFNSGCQWVFDEIQLMGPALPTSRQVEGLRKAMGSAMPCRSMWMSATVDERRLSTIDMASISSVAELGPADRSGPLRIRLAATKQLSQLNLPMDSKSYARSLAQEIEIRHKRGTLTLAVLNTVERARDVYRNLPADQAPTVLLHSRFRSQDRIQHVREALAAVDSDGSGLVVISTQVIEAGVDISATTLFTEAAPWPSIVQRSGRCNRDGLAQGAELLWAIPPKPLPYEEVDIKGSVDALTTLGGARVSSEELGLKQVAVTEALHPVLRRRDLLDLFDTTPDLSGNDLDIGRFIRADDDLDVQVAWRPIPESGPTVDEIPTRRELCPVPVGQLKDYLRTQFAWRFDHLSEAWVKANRETVRPGQVLLLDAAAGGYDPKTGWDPTSKRPVEPVALEPPSEIAPSVEATGDDRGTFATGRWVSLQRHLEDVERAVSVILGALDPPGLLAEHREAAILAGRFHDWGKVHPVFQRTLENSARGADELLSVQDTRPWAKSGGTRRSRHARKHFRHELASALALIAEPGVLNEAGEPDLVTYLVGAHHGKVRLAIRSLPDESPPPFEVARNALGIWDGDTLPSVATHFGTLPEVRLNLSVMSLGESADGRPSWTSRVLKLRDRPDLGPFRLGFLEAVVRLADWKASAEEEA